MPATTINPPAVWEHLLDAIVRCAKRHAPNGELTLPHYAWITDAYQSSLDELARAGATAHETRASAAAVERAVLARVGELRRFFQDLQGIQS